MSAEDDDPKDDSNMPTNTDRETPTGFSNNENTQARAKILAASMWSDSVRLLIGVGGFFAIISTLIGSGMYLAGRASAADVEVQGNRVTKIEQRFEDHRAHSEAEIQRTQQQLGCGGPYAPTLNTNTWPVCSLVFYTDGTGLPTNNYGYAAFIDARSSGGFEMSGLGVLQAGGANFTGLYVDLSHFGNGADSAYFYITRCTFANVYYNGVNYPITAKAHISLAGAISGQIEKNFFARAGNAIRGQENILESSIYSNVIACRDNTFIQLNGAGGAICNPGQSWIIEGDTVEGLQQGAADYLHTYVGFDMTTTAASCDLCSIRNSWCGDAFGDQVWVRLMTAFNVDISTCLFAGGVTGVEFFDIGGSPRAGAIGIIGNEFSVSGDDVDCGENHEWNGIEFGRNDIVSVANLPNTPSTAFIANKIGRVEGSAIADPSVLGTRFIAAIPPEDITVGSPIEAWWKADAIVGLTDGQTVQTWEDSGANDHDLVQASAGSRPIYKTDIQNGLPVVRFDGTKFMADTFANGTGYGVFLVCATDGGSYDSAHDCFFDGSTNNTMRLIRASTSSMDAGGVPLGANPTEWTVYCLEQNGVGDASSVMRAGDVAVQGQPTWVSPGAGITLGARGDGTNGAAIDVGEIIITNRPLRPRERLGLVNYLRAKWNAL